MKEIPLSSVRGRKYKGMVALVDDDIYDYLMQWKWTVLKGRHTFYAYRPEVINHHKVFFLMHRVIANTPSGMETDHIDHNGLNNQRNNLRICSTLQNSRHKQKQTNNKSGHLGVCWDNTRKKWLVSVCKRHYGRFDNFDEACKKADEMNLKIKGEFA